MRCLRWNGRAAGAFLLFAAWPWAAAGAGAAGGDPAAGATARELGQLLPLWSAGPFLGLLVSIAVMPLAAPGFWHHHYPKVAAAWAALFLVPFLFRFRGQALHDLLHVFLIEYVPFVLLLGALFVIAGGIVLRGTLHGTPAKNTLLLAVGTFVASWIGTTGASMLLVRPLLRANEHRFSRVHLVVFFIFLVSNVGGTLTPLGDPPLFLGFLAGVPFFWTLRLLPHTLLVSVLLLGLFYVCDRRLAAREEAPELPPEHARMPLRLAGTLNLLFLAGVVLAVLLSGLVQMGPVDILGVHVPGESLLRDGVLVLLAVLSLRFVPDSIRMENHFTWRPMREVAILFAGIFATILPAVAILRAGEHGALAGLVRAVDAPWHYFWMTGGLSSFLDNAPTYLTFLATALGNTVPDATGAAAIAQLIREHGTILAAISAGAVFMGAMTYIGNAPNFMVRSIAVESGIGMPSFFGYMLRWSIPILVPVFLVVSLVFFR